MISFFTEDNALAFLSWMISILKTIYSSTYPWQMYVSVFCLLLLFVQENVVDKIFKSPRYKVLQVNKLSVSN
jgi:hypothetical protein